MEHRVFSSQAVALARSPWRWKLYHPEWHCGFFSPQGCLLLGSRTHLQQFYNQATFLIQSACFLHMILAFYTWHLTILVTPHAFQKFVCSHWKAFHPSEKRAFPDNPGTFCVRYKLLMESGPTRTCGNSSDICPGEHVPGVMLGAAEFSLQGCYTHWDIWLCTYTSVAVAFRAIPVSTTHEAASDKIRRHFSPRAQTWRILLANQLGVSVHAPFREKLLDSVSVPQAHVVSSRPGLLRNGPIHTDVVISNTSRKCWVRILSSGK